MMNLVSFKILLSLLAIAGKLTYGEGRMGEGLNVRIEAPSAVRVGDTVVLKCLYDLNGESLYTMKWYRGRDEFFRYTPKEAPSIKTFPPLGFSIDLSQSNATHLTLQRANLSLAGRYDCEVTTDFPNVIADVKHVYLRVIAYPEKKPEIVISPNKRRYALGDLLEANCSSYRSKPAANLTWLINGKRVSPYHQHPPQEFRYRDGQNTESSRITIRIEITPQHFVSGQLRLSCVAEIMDHYYQTSEVVVTEEDRPKISSVVDNTSSTGSGSNSRFKNSAGKSSILPSSAPEPVFLLLLMASTYLPSILANLSSQF